VTTLPDPSGAFGPSGPVRIEADLHLLIDGHDVDVRADGDVVSVVSAHPVALVRVLRTVSLPGASPRSRTLGTLADRLERLGLRAEFGTAAGPPLVVLGSVAGSRPLGLLTGSRHVRLDLRSLPRAVRARAVRVRAALTRARGRRR